AEHDLMAVDPPPSIDQRVALAVRSASRFQPIGVALGVLEPQRVFADFRRRQELILSGVKQLLKAFVRADAIMEVATGADAVILFPFLDEDHRPALAALVPQVLGGLPLGQEWDAAADAAQPTHRSAPRMRGRLRQS